MILARRPVDLFDEMSKLDIHVIDLNDLEAEAANAARGCVLRTDAHRLPFRNLAPARDRSGIHLRVQAARRLVSDEVQRKTLRGGAAEPLRRRDPGGVGRAVRIGELGNRVGSNLDASGGSFQRMAFRVAAEILE